MKDGITPEQALTIFEAAKQPFEAPYVVTTNRFKDGRKLPVLTFYNIGVRQRAKSYTVTSTQDARTLAVMLAAAADKCEEGQA